METDKDKLDCGHGKIGRLSVTYCNDCIERIVRRAESAETMLKAKEAAISDLAAEYKRVLRLLAEREES